MDKEKSKGSKIDSGLNTPQDMQRKKAPLGRPGSLVNKSVSSSVFKPGDSQNSFSTTRSKPLVKGGGGALKEKDDMEDMEFGDL